MKQFLSILVIAILFLATTRHSSCCPTCIGRISAATPSFFDDDAYNEDHAETAHEDMRKAQQEEE